MKTLLVIDPNDANRELLAALFGYQGVRVVTAGTVERGIELALSENPDVVVAEFMIPDTAGRCVIEELKRHDQLEDVQIIVWAVEGIGDVAARTSVAGGRFLPKSSPPLVLFQEIHKALGADRAVEAEPGPRSGGRRAPSRRPRSASGPRTEAGAGPREPTPA